MLNRNVFIDGFIFDLSNGDAYLASNPNNTVTRLSRRSNYTDALVVAGSKNSTDVTKDTAVAFARAPRLGVRRSCMSPRLR